MRTEHFNIYFYPEEVEVAEIGALMAEESYLLLERKFSHTVQRRIPLIFYSSPIHFQMTNTIPGLLPEGVAGFTEFIKGRVVLPHNGSFAYFRRVIRHELVHVFTMDKIRTVLKNHRASRFHGPPLWFSEGLAEHWSGDVDSQADMIIKDAVFSENLVPINRMYEINGTFKMYKEGESILDFVAREYGDDKISLIFENWWKSEYFPHIFQSALGVPLSKVDSDWQYKTKKKYLPQIKDSDPVSRVGKKLTSGGVSVKPSVAPRAEGDSSGTYFVFISNRTGYPNIYKKDFGQNQAQKIVKGGRTAEFESFHPLSSKISVSKEGLLAFVSQSKDRDVLYIWDINRARIFKELSFRSIVSLASPCWSPDGRRIVLSGANRGGIFDLYIVDTKDTTLTQLTDDIYNDRDPDWSPDGGKIAFVSDRGQHGKDGFANLSIYDLKTGAIEPLTSGKYKDYSPSWSPNGEHIAFSSDRHGAFDIYTLTVQPCPEQLASTSDTEGSSVLYDVQSRGKTKTREVKRMTNILTGAMDPDWLPDGKTLVFTGYENNSFQIYSVDIHEDIEQEIETVPDDYGNSWRLGRIQEENVKGRARYNRKLSLDFAQSQIVQDPEFGPTGGVQIALTDILGDHQYYISVFNTADRAADIFESFSFAFTRLDLARRTNVAWGIFRLDQGLFNPFDRRFSERRTGGFLTFSYPFSKFERLETSFILRRSERRRLFKDKNDDNLLMTNYVGFTKDNSLWGPTGPMDGERYNFGITHTIDLKGSHLYHTMLLADYRKYQRLSKRTAFAFRAITRYRFGDDPHRFTMGGSWTFRGYDRGSIRGRNIFLINNELRFPLVDNLLIGLPIGGMGFQAIRGAMFLDLGSAWDRGLYFDDMLGSFGAGIRFNIGGFFVLRLDGSRRMDFKSMDNNTEWDFFFGWDF